MTIDKRPTQYFEVKFDNKASTFIKVVDDDIVEQYHVRSGQYTDCPPDTFFKSVAHIKRMHNPEVHTLVFEVCELHYVTYADCVKNGITGAMKTIKNQEGYFAPRCLSRQPARRLVFTHKNCNDGLGALFAAYQCWGKHALYAELAHRPTLDIADPIDLINHLTTDVDWVKYNGPDSAPTLEDLRLADVYFVDFSLRVSQLHVLAPMVKSITVIDHHKGLIDDLPTDIESVKDKNWTAYTLEENVTIIFNNDMSGSTLTRAYLLGEQYEDMPYFAKLLQDRDIWQWNYPETASYSTGLHELNPQTLQAIEDAFDTPVENICKVGDLFEAKKARAISETIRINSKVITVKMNGEEYRALFVNNSDPGIISDLGAKGYGDEKLNTPIVISYSHKGDENVMMMSLRSRKDVDVLPIAKMFGGGGHNQACGCSPTFEQWLEIFTTNTLIVK